MTTNTLRDRHPGVVRLLAWSRIGLVVLLLGAAGVLLWTEGLSGQVGVLAAVSALLMVRITRAQPETSSTRGRRGLPAVRFTWSLATGWQMHGPTSRSLCPVIFGSRGLSTPTRTAPAGRPRRPAAG